MADLFASLPRPRKSYQIKHNHRVETGSSSRRIGRCPLPGLTSAKATRGSNAAAHLPSSYLLQPLMRLCDLTMASFACPLGTARLGDGARLRFRFRPVPLWSSRFHLSPQPGAMIPLPCVKGHSLHP